MWCASSISFGSQIVPKSGIVGIIIPLFCLDNPVVLTKHAFAFGAPDTVARSVKHAFCVCRAAAMLRGSASPLRCASSCRLAVILSASNVTVALLVGLGWLPPPLPTILLGSRSSVISVVVM